MTTAVATDSTTRVSHPFRRRLGSMVALATSLRDAPLDSLPYPLLARPESRPLRKRRGSVSRRLEDQWPLAASVASGGGVRGGSSDDDEGQKILSHFLQKKQFCIPAGCLFVLARLNGRNQTYSENGLHLITKDSASNKLSAGNGSIHIGFHRSLVECNERRDNKSPEGLHVRLFY